MRNQGPKGLSVDFAAILYNLEEFVSLDINVAAWRSIITSHKEERYGVVDRRSISLKAAISFVTLISRSVKESFLCEPCLVFP